MELRTESNPNSGITIWQQNLNKSPTGQHDLISSGRLAATNVDIVAIQELAINFLDKTIATRDWITVYPSTHEKEPKKTHTITLIRSVLPTENWEQIEFDSGDITIVKIHGEWGQVMLFNIYNDCQHDHTIHKLMRFHRTHHESLLGRDAGNGAQHIIWLGDFNRHHPAWNNVDNGRLFNKDALETAKTLIRALVDVGLESALAVGIPTHIHNITKKWT